jgi:hypothetical protein
MQHIFIGDIIKMKIINTETVILLGVSEIEQ